MVKIAPSILSADLANLAAEIKALTKAGADMIHIDIMDGHFVPNLTFGADVIRSIRSYTDLLFDVHLMINNPEKYLKLYADAGADIITIHAETTTTPINSLEYIRHLGKKAGIALSPKDTLESVIPSPRLNQTNRFKSETAQTYMKYVRKAESRETCLDHLKMGLGIKPFLHLVDYILIMTVEPGFGGQQFMEHQIKKISDTKSLLNAHSSQILIGVDGGITSENALACVKAGADILVSGNFIFKYGAMDQSDEDLNELYTQQIAKLRVL